MRRRQVDGGWNLCEGLVEVILDILLDRTPSVECLHHFAREILSWVRREEMWFRSKLGKSRDVTSLHRTHNRLVNNE